jgi:hypothetical protein
MRSSIPDTAKAAAFAVRGDLDRSIDVRFTRRDREGRESLQIRFYRAECRNFISWAELPQCPHKISWCVKETTGVALFIEPDTISLRLECISRLRRTGELCGKGCI